MLWLGRGWTLEGHRPLRWLVPPMTQGDAVPSPDFEVIVIFGRSEVVVVVRGEVDLATAPGLRRVLQSAIEPNRDVVLDLEHCSFLDASGLGVTATVTHALSLLVPPQRLTVRQPSAMTQQIMAITGLDQGIRAEVTLVAERRAPAPITRTPPSGLTITADTVAHALELTTALPANRDLVDRTLELVVALARLTVDGADGVSISLERHGRLSTVAATNQTVLDMDGDQYATNEGPCVDASRQGERFHAEALDRETRWPDFVPKAQSLGINSILSNPLLADGRPIGALNIYANHAGAFHAEDQKLAAQFAAEASGVLTSAGSGVTDAQLATRLVAALRSREVISQAQGVLMRRDAISADDAYSLLQRRSRTTNRPLQELAEEAIATSLGAGTSARPPSSVPRD